MIKELICSMQIKIRIDLLQNKPQIKVNTLLESKGPSTKQNQKSNQQQWAAMTEALN